jgi:hypothetical protein
MDKPRKRATNLQQAGFGRKAYRLLGMVRDIRSAELPTDKRTLKSILELAGRQQRTMQPWTGVLATAFVVLRAERPPAEVREISEQSA